MYEWHGWATLRTAAAVADDDARARLTASSTPSMTRPLKAGIAGSC
jgi:hypothetical protein